MKITRTEKSTLSHVDFDNLTFGKTFTDHMLICTYKNGAWQEPEIKPYQKVEMPLSLHALHYGQAAFEGMKAYKQIDGNVALFRPEENWKRLNRSAVRLLMPEVPKEVFIDGLVELIKLDQNWVPSKPDMSLYIRPFIFSSSDFIAARPSEEYTFAIICSPVSAYYSGAVKVKVEREFSRSAHGGIGFTKAAGNYGGAFYPTEKAKQQGFTQILWTDPKNHEFIEESGTMNVMFIIDNTMVTPALSDRILAGITRASILSLGKEMGMEIQERSVSVSEIEEAAKNGSLKEAFGMGTAAVVSMISHIGFDTDNVVEIPVPEKGIGAQIKKRLNAIRTGESPDVNGWMLKIN
ncbi:MAG: branched-chain amino acid aminotransferase [Schleiferiaceae bacterium]|nr:branched-chain amino acid aminotransferase [Schleiferiaceae bacterium]